jgi:transposase
MNLDIKNGLKIESKKLIDKILLDHISHASFSPSDNLPPLFTNVGQTPDPSCLIPTPSIVSERIDDIPLLLSILLRLDFPKIVDIHHTPHTNHQGLSYGWLLTIWLVYILSESDHRMSHVQDWVAGRYLVLTNITGQTVTAEDFTDDRLARVLKVLSDDTLWHRIEEHLSRHTIRAYNLDLKRIRLDATTASTNHDPEKSSLISIGRTKQDLFEPQFKLMIGTLDPLGLPIATDLVSGEKADDPLYVPIYKRIHGVLGTNGILYIGDSKMAAIETRGTICKDGNFYLVPLPMTGETPSLLDKVLSQLDAGEHELTDIFLPEDEEKFKKLNKDLDPEAALAKGFKIIIQRKTTVDGEEVTWDERVCCVQSFG